MKRINYIKNIEPDDGDSDGSDEVCSFSFGPDDGEEGTFPG